MGTCVGVKNSPYLASQPPITNRSIPPENDNPSHHHGFVNSACGYGFDLQQVDIEQIMRRHVLEQRREQQTEKWDAVQARSQLLRKSYKEHDIDQCMLIIKQIETELKAVDFTLIQDKLMAKQQLIGYIDELKAEYAEMLQFATQLQTDTWVFQSEEDGLTISSRRANNTVGVLMQREIEVPVQIFLTVLSQMEFYSQLIKDIKQSREDRTIARNHKIGYCLYNLPLLSVRQTYFEALGYNRLNHNNTIFMYSRSIHDKPELCQKLNFTPKINKDYVQIEYKYLMVRYVPISEKRGRASIAVNIDMKLNFVPLGLMEFVCKLAFKDFFRLVMEASDRFEGSKWEQKIKKYPQTYNFFKGLITEYYNKNKAMRSTT